jgi:hypothetical protein
LITIRILILVIDFQMEYPHEWIFLSPEEAANFNFNPNRPLSMTVLVDFTDGTAGAFRQILGGSEILEVVFPADQLFGSEFSGKSTLFLYKPLPPPALYVTGAEVSLSFIDIFPVLPRNNARCA